VTAARDSGGAAALVDPARIEADLVRLVRTPSITGSEEAVQAVMEKLLRGAGLETQRIETDPAAFAATDPDWPGQEMPRATLPVIIGRIGRPGGRRALLVGHVDVVPIGDPATWTVDPWGADVRDGRLYGRGACDMKGGVAAILEAVRAVTADGAATDFEGELVVASVPSEEDGGQGMLAAIRAIEPTASGAAADVAVITEPTAVDGEHMEIVVAHAGAITFTLTVPGRAAHASVRREGVSALDNLSYLVWALGDDEQRRNDAETDPLMTALGLPYPTIVGTVSGGDWPSTVMDRVVAQGRYGVKLGQTWRDAERDLREAIDEACDADAFLSEHRPTVEITGGKFSSARVAADDALPVGLADAAEATLGRRPNHIGVPYGADMRLLVNEGRTPTVIYGPGDIHVAHAADEWTPLGQVVECSRVLAAWLERELRPA
jgi:acetylornithine deacetylase